MKKYRFPHRILTQDLSGKYRKRSEVRIPPRVDIFHVLKIAAFSYCVALSEYLWNESVERVYSTVYLHTCNSLRFIDKKKKERRAKNLCFFISRRWGILCVNCACRSTVISPFDIIPCQPVLRLWLSAHSHAWKCLNSRFFFVFHRLDDLRLVLEGGKIIDQLSFVWLKIHLYQKTLYWISAFEKYLNCV